jgi:hypothetical protein
METPRKRQGYSIICLISEIYEGRSFSFHDADSSKENKFNFKEAIVSALSLIQIK